MSRGDPVVRARRPDLVQRRGERLLLVWGSAGSWIVADDELHSLVRELDGRRPLSTVVRRLASRWGRAPAAVATEVSAALDALSELGVVGPIASREEPVEIANVTVNVTNRCNLRCSHCYNEPRGEELAADVLAAALRDATPVLGARATLILLGGEPLLDVARLAAIVDGVRGTFAAPPMLSTNATRIDAAVAARLAALDVDVQVSLDGPTAAINDEVRGRGSFDLAVAGVRHLVGQSVPVTLSMVYDVGNLDRMGAYADLARDLGASEVRFIPLRLIGRGTQHQTRAPDQRQAVRILLDLLERRPELRPLLRRDFFTITREVCRRSGPRESCGIGRRVVFLDADGQVYPCPNHRSPDYRCGSVTADSLPDIVRSSPTMERVRREFRVSRYQDCPDCPVRPWCAGDCRGEAVALGGHPGAPVPHCEEMGELIPDLMWLIADGDERLGQPAEGGDFL